jgi:hypothetical protein
MKHAVGTTLNRSTSTWRYMHHAQSLARHFTHKQRSAHTVHPLTQQQLNLGANYHVEQARMRALERESV